MSDYLTFSLNVDSVPLYCAVEESSVMEVVFGLQTSRLPLAVSSMAVGLASYQEDVYVVYNLENFCPSSAWVKSGSSFPQMLAELQPRGSYLICEFVNDGLPALSAFLVSELGEIHHKDDLHKEPSSSGTLSSTFLVDSAGKKFELLDLRELCSKTPADIISNLNDSVPLLG